MTIAKDAVIEFFGTQDALDDTSATVIDGAFSLVGDLKVWVNDDDALLATVTLEVTFATTPDDNSTVSLYAQKLNVVSTSDNDVPDANFEHTAFGVFPINNVTTAQFITIDIELQNWITSSIYQFFIRNEAGQTMSAGWDVHITPKTIGPHP